MIVRTPESSENIRTYIRMNPWKTPFTLPVESGFVQATGNPVLWNFPKTGILCSRKIPAEADYMPPIDDRVVYMSGFHSPPEKEIFKVLLARGARIIYCPAWPINEMALTPFAEALKKIACLLLKPPESMPLSCRLVGAMNLLCNRPIDYGFPFALSAECWIS